MPRWTYLFLHDDTDPDTERVVIERSGMTSELVPVPRIEDAPDYAAAAERDGSGLIELCGGFDTATVARVRERVGVPVGQTVYAVDSVAGAAAYAAQFRH